MRRLGLLLCWMGVWCAITGCGGARFRQTCEAIQVGEEFQRVMTALEEAGGRYAGKLPDRNQHQWTRPKWFFKVQNCAVDFDASDHVIRARYSEHDDLL